MNAQLCQWTLSSSSYPGSPENQFNQYQTLPSISSEEMYDNCINDAKPDVYTTRGMYETGIFLNCS
jgi:hypothetical protein